jgi:hypothetical protein
MKFNFLQFMKLKKPALESFIHLEQIALIPANLKKQQSNPPLQAVINELERASEPV